MWCMNYPSIKPMNRKDKMAVRFPSSSQAGAWRLMPSATVAPGVSTFSHSVHFGALALSLALLTALTDVTSLTLMSG